jgi:small ligand-binding sensory domain FIST
MPAQSRLQFASSVSTNSDTLQAADEACQALKAGLSRTADLVVVFFSGHHREGAVTLLRQIKQQLKPAHVIGCSGESIVASGREIEEQPAISLWAASLEGARLLPIRLEFERSAEGGSILGWPDELADRSWPEGASLLLLGEPYSFPADWLLQQLNEQQPGSAVFGGMASGAQSPGENVLLLDNQVYSDGAVGIWIHGGVRLRTVVSQGCRPIGRPMVVTKSQQNILIELGGKPAFAQLHELWPQLSGEDQRLVQRGLHVGQVINEYQDQFTRGDFLIRNVVGADPEKGVIAIGDFVKTGRTVQFHVRDAQAADEDLNELLNAAAAAGAKPMGALLFTCNGRGSRLFAEPDHDAGVLAKQLGAIPTAGFFAAGEIGPIAGKNFLHGFTASVVLFESAE